MKSYLINFVTSLMDFSLLYFYLHYTRNVFEMKKSRLIKVIVVLLLLSTANAFMNEIAGIANIFGFFPMLIMVFVCFTYLLEEDFLQLFLPFLTGVLLMFVLELIVANSIVFIFQLPPSQMLNMGWPKISGILLSKGTFYFLVRRKLYGFPLLLNRLEENKLVSLIVFFNIIIVYLSFIIYKSMENNGFQYYHILFLLMLSTIIISWTIFILTKKIIIQQQEESLLNLKLREYENQKLYVQNMEDMLLNIRAQRHDLNNYISTLYGMIHLGQFDAAKKYMINLEQNLSNINQIIDANHPVITALLSVKYHKSLREKIKMNVQVDFPESLNINYLDLSIILGNILDNAIEACMNKNIVDPTINMEMHVKKNYLIIKMLNSKDPEIVFNGATITRGFTTKTDKEGHGFGLSNIKRIVEENCGILKLQDQKNFFSTYIAIPLQGNS